MKCLLKTAFSLVILAGLLAASGCNSTSRLLATGLEVELTGLERQTDGSVAVSWQFSNSNIAPYLISRQIHKIQLNGTTIGTITEKEALALPATSHAGRTATLTGLDANANRVLGEAVAAGSANYRLDTQITILIFDDNDEKSVLAHSGTVKVTAK